MSCSSAGRVRNPLGAGVAVVQDPALEAEADHMGMRAAHFVSIQAKMANMDRVNPRQEPPYLLLHPQQIRQSCKCREQRTARGFAKREPAASGCFLYC